jgi:hypothetical protein
MAPIFEQAATELEPEVRLVKVDSDAAPELLQRFSIQGTSRRCCSCTAGGRLRAGRDLSRCLSCWARSRMLSRVVVAIGYSFVRLPTRRHPTCCRMGRAIELTSIKSREENNLAARARFT